LGGKFYPTNYQIKSRQQNEEMQVEML